MHFVVCFVKGNSAYLLFIAISISVRVYINAYEIGPQNPRKRTRYGVVIASFHPVLCAYPEKVASIVVMGCVFDGKVCF